MSDETLIPCDLVLLESGGARLRIVAKEGVKELILSRDQAAIARDWALWSPTPSEFGYDSDGVGCVEGSAFPREDERDNFEER